MSGEFEDLLGILLDLLGDGRKIFGSECKEELIVVGMYSFKS